jgi:hypothetical protein
MILDTGRTGLMGLSKARIFDSPRATLTGLHRIGKRVKLSCAWGDGRISRATAANSVAS